MTRWAEDVDPDGPHPLYPRPIMEREEWTSLNGLWDFTIVSQHEEIPSQFSEQILVPFCVESALSGVMRRVEADQVMVYQRSFQMNKSWKNKRIKLVFEAVDYEANVFINNVEVGSHKGGYDAFSFDITEHMNNQDEQVVRVLVKDPTEKQAIPVGKQWNGPARDMQFIFYTPTSGIWQTVWLEPVEEEAVESIEMVPDVDRGSLRLRVNTTKREEGEMVVSVMEDGQEVVKKTISANTHVDIQLGKEFKTWSPQSPFLYDLKLRLNSGDEVTSYFGMRKIEMKKVDNFQRIFLNNELLPFQLGPLDQGYWPDGILTPPTEDALKWDLEQTKRLGFNMVRKHIKIESARWYYWADKMGLLVWQDFPCISDKQNPGDLPEAQENFEREYTAWIEQHWNHPSIILWVVFNEAWGQFDTVEVTLAVMKKDPTRLVTCASGWDDFPVGHIADAHVYPGPSNNGSKYAPADTNRAAVVGELWGQSKIPWGHCWFGDKAAEKDPRGGFKTEEEFLAHYDAAIVELMQLKDSHGYTAAVFTQTTDVEAEFNGYFSYDRQVQKVSLQALAGLHKKIVP